MSGRGDDRIAMYGEDTSPHRGGNIQENPESQYPPATEEPEEEI